MTSERGCIFCAIIAGEAPASQVFEDDLILAFMDLYPVNPGHVLVVPKVHAARLADVEARTYQRMFEVAGELAQALYDAELRCEGVNLFLADGASAGQAVFHSHLHVIPRHRGDGAALRLHDGPPASRARKDLERDATALRNALDGP